MSNDSVPSEGTHTFSCLACRERKVKCDRGSPCSNCAKADKLCSFVPPVRGKRKRTKPPRESLHAKLMRYESLLRSYGASIEQLQNCTSDDIGSDTSSPPDQAQGGEGVQEGGKSASLFSYQNIRAKLVTSGGTSRYYDSALWSNLGQAVSHLSPLPDTAPDRRKKTLMPTVAKFQHPEVGGPVEQINSDGTVEESELFFEPENNHANVNLASLHPAQHVLSQLREIYVDRADALVKIVHIPSFWKILMEQRKNSHHIPVAEEALIFAFYLSTISTLEENECRDMFGLPKSVAFSRYRSATRQALVKAGFPATSSPTTLQAYALFMVRTSRSMMLVYS